MDVAYFWIMFGALIGWIASVLQGKIDLKSILTYIVIGVIGGFLGGRLSYLISMDVRNYDAGMTSIMLSVFGAIILVAIMGRGHDDRSYKD
jgi:uncharacterized membrane protein YeaQ/YmgE (transglycosylase-associated protein family)